MILICFTLSSNERSLHCAWIIFQGLGASDECRRAGIMGLVLFQCDFRIHIGIAVRAAMRAGICHADVATQGAAAVFTLARISEG